MNRIRSLFNQTHKLEVIASPVRGLYAFRMPLLMQTIDAVRAGMAARPAPIDKEHRELAFLTCFEGPGRGTGP